MVLEVEAYRRSRIGGVGSKKSSVVLGRYISSSPRKKLLQELTIVTTLRMETCRNINIHIGRLIAPSNNGKQGECL